MPLSIQYTGSAEIKTASQVELFGGTAGTLAFLPWCDEALATLRATPRNSTFREELEGYRKRIE